jgi:hypothetical protein
MRAVVAVEVRSAVVVVAVRKNALARKHFKGVMTRMVIMVVLVVF